MSTRGVMISEAVVSPNLSMPSSISLSSPLAPSVISSARESSSVLMSWACLVTTRFTKVPDFISRRAGAPSVRYANVSPGSANLAQVTG